MEFALLGPLEVHGQGVALPLRRGRPRTVLISLLLQAGHAVRADVLIDRVWGDELPLHAANALQVHVSYLRRALGLVAVGEGPALRTVAGGYVLDVPLDCIDVHRFEWDVASAAERLGRASQADAAGALRRLRGALDLWRGEPLQDVADQPFALAEIERLHELRASALEGEIDARLALGEHEAVVPALRQLIADHPLRERFRAQLVLALYRSNRQADALRAFDATRELLVEELGVEPGRDLQNLQRAVLDHDVGLDWVLQRDPGADGPPQAAALRVGPDMGNRAVVDRVTRLPAPTTRLVGRERELARVAETMADNRMVTLIGPGGAGKTRLALAVAHGEGARRPVWLVELADIRDPGVVPFEIAHAVAVGSTPDPLDAVSVSIGNQPALVVLDTCEHQLDECAAAALRLLRSCPALGILATSRQPLGVVGEVAWPVPPLALAPPGAPIDQLRDAEAVVLFCERARAARPGFELDASNARAIADICRTVDGLPLAIELAAARVSVLTPAAILERLDDRFALLSRVGRASERRQQSLRAAIEWSDDLLDGDQRAYFHRLGVFAGRFPLDAASQVAGAGLRSDPLELLDAMVDRSLVVADGDDSYRMLDSLRAYAAAALASDGAERDAAHRRLATWMADFADAADRRLHGPEQQDALARLRRQVPNSRAALQWSFDGGDTALGIRLACSLAWFWALEGANEEANRWLAEGLAAPGLDGGTRALLLEGMGMRILVLGDVARAQWALQEATDYWNRAGAPERGVIGLIYLGVTHRWFGRLDEAAAVQDRAITLAREYRDPWRLAWSLMWRAGTAVDQGQDSRAANMLEESRLLAQRTGDPSVEGWIVKELADAALRVGDVDRALVLIDEAVDIFETIRWNEGLAAAHTTAGRALLTRGRTGDSLAHHRRALRTASDHGMPHPIAEALEGLAEAISAAGDHRGGAALLGSAAGVRSQMGAPKLAVHRRRDLDALTAALCRRLGDAEFAAAFGRGQQRTLTDVVAGLDVG